MRTWTPLQAHQSGADGAGEKVKEAGSPRPVPIGDRTRDLVQRFLHGVPSSRELFGSLIERIELTESKEIIIRFRIVNTTFKAIEELKCPKYIFDNIALQNISSFSSVQEIKCALDTLIQDVFLAFREEDADLREEISGDRSVQFQRIKEYIQQHFSEADFSVKAIAAEFDMSVSNLSHFFKKQQSENISDYILQLRIHKSKQLIRMTDQTFQDISLACGYANISTFLRQFKQSEQMTPSQYRAIHRKTPMQTIEE